MSILIVVSNVKDWQFDIAGVEVISTKNYLTDTNNQWQKGARVFNLSRSYRYQSAGYYVSLLAAARGHKAIPSIATLQEMRSPSVLRIITTDLDETIQRSLAELRSDRFTLSIYFGRNLSKKYDKLSLQLFNLFQAPLLRAQFVRERQKQPNAPWVLQGVGPIAASEIPADHLPYVREFATAYFAGKRFSVPKRDVSGYDLAILVNPKEEVPPSSEKTIQKFVKAAELLGLSVDLITRDDYSRLGEYDALFIRETTSVNHYTFRFAQRAAAEGLVVIDDPESIIRCTNKVYLAELLERNHLLAPRTLILHRDNVDHVKQALGYPCILKQPDSSFSQGVCKAKDEAEFDDHVAQMFEKSDLIVAQEFLPTEFDWRVGILDREPIYLCKYYMATKHWQIMNWAKTGGRRLGRADTLPVELAPPGLLRVALQASNLIGDGLYGVDIKQIDKKFYVIEVNDNPSLDTGIEDAVVKDKLYTRIMEVVLKRIKKLKGV